MHLHFTCNEDVFTQHTKNNTCKFNIEKKTSIKAQSEGHALVNLLKTSENESKKDALSEAIDFDDSNPVALERTVW